MTASQRTAPERPRLGLRCRAPSFPRYAEATFDNDVDLAGYLRATLFDDKLNEAVDWSEEQQSDDDPPG